MTRGKSAQLRKVDEAKRVVQRALGEAARGDSPQVEKYVPMTKLPEPTHIKEMILLNSDRRIGAHARIRTGDLFLTKEMLYRLSYVGAP